VRVRDDRRRCRAHWFLRHPAPEWAERRRAAGRRRSLVKVGDVEFVFFSGILSVVDAALASGVGGADGG